MVLATAITTTMKLTPIAHSGMTNMLALRAPRSRAASPRCGASGQGQNRTADTRIFSPTRLRWKDKDKGKNKEKGALSVSDWKRNRHKDRHTRCDRNSR